jgi:hypothetical protein
MSALPWGRVRYWRNRWCSSDTNREYGIPMLLAQIDRMERIADIFCGPKDRPYCGLTRRGGPLAIWLVEGP